jgi:hypothetical protein
MSLMSLPEPETDEEPNPFEGFSFAEICGFIHRKEGENGLRELLAMFNDFTCEFLAEAASELTAAGLSKPATILTALAATTPSELDSGNPYDEDDRLNWSEWRRSWLNRRRVLTGEIERNLRAQRLRKQQQAKHASHPTRH